MMAQGEARRMVGKPPHRPAGKARTDEEHRAVTRSRGPAFDTPSRAAVQDENLAMKARNERAPEVDADEPIGGSRPGVPSRMRDAVESRMEREND